MTSQFEERIRALTEPINGQLPRPWMTELKNPLEADVFIVGMNPGNKYPAGEVRHQRHVDALFNRNSETCRGLYDENTRGKPSPTRQNIDRLVARLNRQGIRSILETNVVCYSTPMSAGLSNPGHSGGARRGEEIFRYLLATIAPRVLIVHGSGTVKRISAILGIDRLKLPVSADEIRDVHIREILVIPIPSLAPPAFNKWKAWSDEYLDGVAIRVRNKVSA